MGYAQNLRDRTRRELCPGRNDAIGSPCGDEQIRELSTNVFLEEPAGRPGHGECATMKALRLCGQIFANVATDPTKDQASLLGRSGKVGRPAEDDFMAGRLDPLREREHWIDVAAGSLGCQGIFHWGAPKEFTPYRSRHAAA